MLYLVGCRSTLFRLQKAIEAAMSSSQGWGEATGDSAPEETILSGKVKRTPIVVVTHDALENLRTQISASGGVVLFLDPVVGIMSAQGDNFSTAEVLLSLLEG